jgi:hypothetical protein
VGAHPSGARTSARLIRGPEELDVALPDGCCWDVLHYVDRRQMHFDSILIFIEQDFRTLVKQPCPPRPLTRPLQPR